MERQELQGYNEFSSKTSESIHQEAYRDVRKKLSEIDFLQNELKNGVIPNSSVTFNQSNEVLVGGLLTENTQDRVTYVNILDGEQDYSNCDTGRVADSIMEHQVNQSKKFARDAYNEYERASQERARSKSRSPIGSARTGISSQARQKKNQEQMGEIERREKQLQEKYNALRDITDGPGGGMQQSSSQEIRAGFKSGSMSTIYQQKTFGEQAPGRVDAEIESAHSKVPTKIHLKHNRPMIPASEQHGRAKKNERNMMFENHSTNGPLQMDERTNAREALAEHFTQQTQSNKFPQASYQGKTQPSISQTECLDGHDQIINYNRPPQDLGSNSETAQVITSHQSSIHYDNSTEGGYDLPLKVQRPSTQQTLEDRQNISSILQVQQQKVEDVQVQKPSTVLMEQSAPPDLFTLNKMPETSGSYRKETITSVERREQQYYSSNFGRRFHEQQLSDKKQNYKLQSISAEPDLSRRNYFRDEPASFVNRQRSYDGMITQESHQSPQKRVFTGVTERDRPITYHTQMTDHYNDRVASDHNMVSPVPMNSSKFNGPSNRYTWRAGVHNMHTETTSGPAVKEYDQQEEKQMSPYSRSSTKKQRQMREQANSLMGKTNKLIQPQLIQNNSYYLNTTVDDATGVSRNQVALADAIQNKLNSASGFYSQDNTTKYRSKSIQPDKHSLILKLYNKNVPKQQQTIEAQPKRAAKSVERPNSNFNHRTKVVTEGNSETAAPLRRTIEHEQHVKLTGTETSNYNTQAMYSTNSTKIGLDFLKYKQTKAINSIELSNRQSSTKQNDTQTLQSTNLERAREDSQRLSRIERYRKISGSKQQSEHAYQDQPSKSNIEDAMRRMQAFHDSRENPIGSVNTSVVMDEVLDSEARPQSEPEKPYDQERMIRDQRVRELEIQNKKLQDEVNKMYNRPLNLKQMSQESPIKAINSGELMVGAGLDSHRQSNFTLGGQLTNKHGSAGTHKFESDQRKPVQPYDPGKTDNFDYEVFKPQKMLSYSHLNPGSQTSNEFSREETFQQQQKQAQAIQQQTFKSSFGRQLSGQRSRPDMLPTKGPPVEPIQLKNFNEKHDQNQNYQVYRVQMPENRQVKENNSSIEHIQPYSKEPERIFQNSGHVVTHDEARHSSERMVYRSQERQPVTGFQEQRLSQGRHQLEQKPMSQERNSGYQEQYEQIDRIRALLNNQKQIHEMQSELRENSYTRKLKEQSQSQKPPLPQQVVTINDMSKSFTNTQGQSFAFFSDPNNTLMNGLRGAVQQEANYQHETISPKQQVYQQEVSPHKYEMQYRSKFAMEMQRPGADSNFQSIGTSPLKNSPGYITYNVSQTMHEQLQMQRHEEILSNQMPQAIHSEIEYQDQMVDHISSSKPGYQHPEQAETTSYADESMRQNEQQIVMVNQSEGPISVEDSRAETPQLANLNNSRTRNEQEKLSTMKMIEDTSEAALHSMPSDKHLPPQYSRSKHQSIHTSQNSLQLAKKRKKDSISHSQVSDNQQKTKRSEKSSKSGKSKNSQLTSMAIDNQKQLAAVFDMIVPNTQEPVNLKKLLKMQFDQFQMLQDLQEQFQQCKELEQQQVANPFVEENSLLNSSSRSSEFINNYKSNKIRGRESSGASTMGGPYPIDAMSQEQSQTLRDDQSKLNSFVASRPATQQDYHSTETRKNKSKNQKQSVESNFQSAVSCSPGGKLSQTQLSNISQNKQTTLNLIQKIYSQMEKIDAHISNKAKLDEARYKEMERKMRKLYKRYQKVKQEGKRTMDQMSVPDRGIIRTGRSSFMTQPQQDIENAEFDIGVAEAQMQNAAASSHMPMSDRNDYVQQRSIQVASPPIGDEATIEHSKKSFNAQYPSDAPVVEVVSQKSFNNQYPSVQTLSHHDVKSNHEVQVQFPSVHTLSQHQNEQREVEPKQSEFQAQFPASNTMSASVQKSHNEFQMVQEMSINVDSKSDSNSNVNAIQIQENEMPQLPPHGSKQVMSFGTQAEQMEQQQEAQSTQSDNRQPPEMITEVSNRLELSQQIEHQVELQNAIEMIRQEHADQMVQMQQFYKEQMQFMREEMVKVNKSNEILKKPYQNTFDSQNGTPGQHPGSRVKSMSGENILNLTNLTISASEQKPRIITQEDLHQLNMQQSKASLPSTNRNSISPHLQKKHELLAQIEYNDNNNNSALETLNVVVSDQQIVQSESNLTQVKEIATEKELSVVSKSVVQIERQHSSKSEVLTQVDVNDQSEQTQEPIIMQNAMLTQMAQTNSQAQEALAKLLDQGQMTTTLDQLNKAVDQKVKLEQKLARIKEKIKEAKNVRKNARSQSKSVERRPTEMHYPPSQTHTMSDINTEDVYRLIVGNAASDLATEDQLNINSGSQMNTQMTQKVNNLGSTASLPANVNSELITAAQRQNSAKQPVTEVDDMIPRTGEFCHNSQQDLVGQSPLRKTQEAQIMHPYTVVTDTNDIPISMNTHTDRVDVIQKLNAQHLMIDSSQYTMSNQDTAQLMPRFQQISQSSVSGKPPMDLSKSRSHQSLVSHVQPVSRQVYQQQQNNFVAGPTFGNSHQNILAQQDMGVHLSSNSSRVMVPSCEQPGRIGVYQRIYQLQNNMPSPIPAIQQVPLNTASNTNTNSQQVIVQPVQLETATPSSQMTQPNQYHRPTQSMNVRVKSPPQNVNVPQYLNTMAHASPQGNSSSLYTNTIVNPNSQGVNKYVNTTIASVQAPTIKDAYQMSSPNDKAYGTINEVQEPMVQSKFESNYGQEKYGQHNYLSGHSLPGLTSSHSSKVFKKLHQGVQHQTVPRKVPESVDESYTVDEASTSNQGESEALFTSDVVSGIDDITERSFIKKK